LESGFDYKCKKALVVGFKALMNMRRYRGICLISIDIVIWVSATYC